MLPSLLRAARSSSSSSLLPSSLRVLVHSGPVMSVDAESCGPVQRVIRSKLIAALSPDHLEVHNESHQHAVPPGSESHFRVLVVSGRFEGLSLLQRHRLVNEALQEELKHSVHALAIQAKTPQQWKLNPTINQSPACRGGGRGDRSVEEKLQAGRE